MTENTKSTRRTVLKKLSATAAAGPILVREATNVEATGTQSADDTESAIPFDLRVRNNAFDSKTVLVEIFKAEEKEEGSYEAIGKPVYRRSVPLKGIEESGGNAANAMKAGLELQGECVYKIKSSIPNSNEVLTGRFVGLPEGGVPPYMAILVDYTLSGELEVYTAKQ